MMCRQTTQVKVRNRQHELALAVLERSRAEAFNDRVLRWRRLAGFGRHGSENVGAGAEVCMAGGSHGCAAKDASAMFSESC